MADHGRRVHYAAWAIAVLVATGIPLGVARAQTVDPGATDPNAQPDGGMAPISPLSRPESHDHDQDSPDDKKGAAGQQAPPPTLPGSHAEPTAVAPPDKDLSAISPTDALFDAINRGDIAAARDALSRGADTTAKNVLGQTPLASSVDLGRNDISFLLLSMRPPGQSTSEAAATEAPEGSNGLTPLNAEHMATAASDSAAPQPNTGFLGFDGS